MIYTMSTEEKSQQLGQLMLDKKASEQRLAELTLKASNTGKSLVDIGSVLIKNPSLLAFTGDEVPLKQMQGVSWLPNSNIITGEELRGMTNAIRAERTTLSGLQDDLKILGF